MASLKSFIEFHREDFCAKRTCPHLHSYCTMYTLGQSQGGIRRLEVMEPKGFRYMLRCKCDIAAIIPVEFLQKPLKVCLCITNVVCSMQSETSLPPPQFQSKINVYDINTICFLSASNLTTKFNLEI